ncbi:mycofactocin precursor MftA [Nocardioides aurantiacus]|uniref:Mycofactocin n=1 Tax=Nocardioides aurantiacus TaxID=86796 RepID=A0A3N2CQF8_9ACTN|nr:mycofactocin precursor MftA [Nocardioides aurantiacus]ROR89755.1 mycofactocin precursor [Nocardioides aurantiacus]
MTPEQPSTTAEQSAAAEPATGEVVTDSLVEEVSIDGMCGVY